MKHTGSPQSPRIFTAVLCLAGSGPLLRALRRGVRQARFDAPVAFVPGEVR